MSMITARNEIVNSQEIDIWSESNLPRIKNMFAKNLNELEFQAYIGIGRNTGLNPFLRELWAVKYGNSAAQIFIGRDGYRKSAQRSSAYDFHIADAVYGNDDFGVDNGRVMHRYKLRDRGELVGAYCTVQRKGSTMPCYVFVELNEYNKRQSVWNEKPATMIKKVAEAQGLRMAFQEIFAGTYHEYEQWRDETRRLQKTVQPKIIDSILAIDQKDDIKTFDLDDMVLEMSKASALNELQDIYTRHYRTCTSERDMDAMKALIIAKDRIKDQLQQKELDKKVDEFIAEMDEGENK